MSFWGELRRRNVVKVALAYAIVGWLIAQVASVFAPALNLPDWVLRFVAFILVLGFPIALFLAWAYEVTPEGVKRTKHVPVAESITHLTGQKLNYMVTGLLVLAVGFMVIDVYLLDASGRDVPMRPRNLPKVAVLPCSDLNRDPDRAWFAPAFHDEILNQLAKLSGLLVIARTSVMRYAESAPSIPEVANELNATGIMECTIAQAGDIIRVTAQLIDPETSTHIWSDTFAGDLREPNSVFTMQAEIARNIANALGAQLSLREREDIETIPTESAEAYSLYLEARGLREPSDFSVAHELLDRALSYDPDFGLAHALKARLYASSLSQNFAGTIIVELEPPDLERLALEHAGKALAQDSRFADAYLARGATHGFYWRWQRSLEAYEVLLQVSPNHAEGLRFYALANSHAGRHEQAIRLAQTAVEVDPTANSYFWLATAYGFAGNAEAAIANLESATRLNPSHALAYLWLGQLEIGRGNDMAALEHIRRAEELVDDPSPVTLGSLAYAYSRLERREHALQLCDRLQELSSDQNVGAGTWALAYLALGETETALEWIERAAERIEDQMPDASFPQLMAIKLNPWSDPVLERPEFVDVRNRLTGI